jgi:outer membrane protein TolC
MVKMRYSKMVMASFLVATTVMAGAQTSKLTLDSAVDIAAKSNYQTQNVLLQRMLAKERVELAKAAYTPTVNALARARYSTNIAVSSSDSYGGVGQNASALLRSRYAIYDGGSRRAAMEIAKLGLLSTTATVQQTFLALELTITGSYYGLVSAQRQIDAVQSELDAMTENANSAKRKFDAGEIPALEVTAAQQAKAAAEAALIQAKLALRSAQIDLAESLGEPADSFHPKAVMETTKNPGASGDLVELILKNSPSLVLSHLATLVDQQNLVAAQAKRRWLITVSASAGLVDAINPFSNSSASSVDPYLEVGITFELPIIDHTLKESENIEKLAVQSDTLQEKHLREQLRDQALLTIEQLGALPPQIASSKEAETLAQQTYDSAKRRFEAGAATSIDVIDAYGKLELARALVVQLTDQESVLSSTLKFEVDAQHLPKTLRVD